MNPLPVTVIGGYLGAGKTTLINQLLKAPQGQRLFVIVNDFGAINIDQSLLAARDEDTIALTNGCVCCTMGADLFMALGDVLDRNPRPDHLIVEASGIADPTKIANAAITEPDMRHAGILTVVDAMSYDGLRRDPLIGAQFAQQIACADLVAISKAKGGVPKIDLSDLTRAPVLTQGAPEHILHLVADIRHEEGPLNAALRHPDYVSWSSQDRLTLPEDALRTAFAARPRGLFRVKGKLPYDDQTSWIVQCVGTQVEINATAGVHTANIVGIGLAGMVTLTEIEAWWNDCLARG
ncbi:CobW/HypB/UreG family nucleotide-binding protein [Yoonia maricola]|uniref:CobW/HypB/UreG family nucleotide-binding protein n=1 Tax=Yoonia maricola TaxID=420999 RepID=A0A2M8W0C4_9RHOB|nr:GTP-binding protein [Yoonia maricola]PJI84374.1 CobW/HypB/UreG family nucleotide-binding protein [Yoonia maricola]